MSAQPTSGCVAGAVVSSASSSSHPQRALSLGPVGEVVTTVCKQSEGDSADEHFVAQIASHDIIKMGATLPVASSSARSTLVLNLGTSEGGAIEMLPGLLYGFGGAHVLNGLAAADFILQGIGRELGGYVAS